MPHIHYLYDYVISAFIIHENSVLLVQHPRYDKWLPIGGHIELHEDPEEALFREVAEEANIPVEPLGTRPDVTSAGTKFILQPDYIDVHDANPPHKHISLIYFLRALSAKFTLSDEHSDMRWVSADDLDDPVYDLAPALLFYARQALAANGADRSSRP